MTQSTIPGSAYDEAVYVVSAGQLWELLGRELTAEEKERVADCIPNSSIPDALDTIMGDGLGLRAESDEESD